MFLNTKESGGPGGPASNPSGVVVYPSSALPLASGTFSNVPGQTAFFLWFYHFAGGESYSEILVNVFHGARLSTMLRG